MTLAQFRAFVAAMELGTLTAAANELDVSQASVSELVSRLEAELGVALFVRGARKLVPTAAAEELLPYARRSLGAAADAATAMRSLASLETGVATFGVLRNANFYGLSSLVHRFHTAHPGVRIRMVGLNSYFVAQAVESGELEAGLVVLPIASERLEIEPLVVDEVRFATSGPAPVGGAATLDDLVGAGLILYDAHSGWRDPTRRQLLDRAHAAGVRIEPTIEVEQVETALTLVAQGVGATLVSGSIVRSGALPEGVTSYPFAEPFEETIALVTRQGSPISRATSTIAELAKRSIRTARP
jgi:DNA-binding transcriptional LysR family regulator